MNEFYVYKWFYKDSGVIFYIGKGKNNRYKNKSTHRNEYFKNIIKKEKDNVDVDFIANNLTEEEAFALERQLITEYWEKGECKANFHEGGCGGNTHNYNNAERSRKLSEFAKTRVGEKNPMWGKHHSDEVKQKLRIANLGKKLTLEHIEKLKKANKNRVKTIEERKKLSEANKGKKMTLEQYQKMMERECKFIYQISFKGEKIFQCDSLSQLNSFCKNNFNISKTICEQIIKNKWKPTFNKHKDLNTLKIIKINKSVSTKGDECNLVR